MVISELGDSLQWSGALETYTSMARDRTAALRKWLLRSQELSSEEKDFDMPVHCAQILKGKSMRLMHEMLIEAEYADCNLPNEIAKGFKLMGPLPRSGVMPRNVVVGTLTERDVLDTAKANNVAIWNATHSCQDAQIAQDVYQATLDEKARGWLTGPYTLQDLPAGAVLTRRFGIKQGSKTRPIDDYSESLVN